MTTSDLWTRRALLAAGAAAWMGSSFAAETFPSRPLKLIVPFAPGGTGDLVARALANQLSSELGQTVVVDNRGGAGSIIGTDAGAKAVADGYTLTMTNGAAVTTGPLIGQTLAYRPLDDFAHLFLIGTFPNMLVVRAEHPAKDFREFVSIYKKDARGMSWGSAGVGSAGFLAGELLHQLAQLHMIHVPYKGTGPAMTDLLGGSLDAVLTSPAVAAPHIQTGKLRALAVSSATRLADFPDVPTMDEAVPGAIGDAWFGISVPAKTPQPARDRLQAGLLKVHESPAFRTQLQKAGLTPMGLAQQEFGTFLRSEIAKWTPVLRGVKIRRSEPSAVT